MTGQPEHVPPLAEDAIPEVPQHGYQAYPLVDHVADKVAATYERYGTAGMPSTRYRDLVDLVSIVTGASIPAADQLAALVSEFDRRQLDLPASFDVPDGACGSPATPPRPAARFSRKAAPWKRPSASSHRSSIPCWTKPRPDTGIQDHFDGYRRDALADGVAD